MFLGALRRCGNVAAAARAVGFSESLIWQRRRKWPAFAMRMEEALEEAEVELEFRLAALGQPFVEGAEWQGRPSTALGTGPSTSLGTNGDGPPPAPLPRAGGGMFDPEFALRFLKWREEKRRGSGRRGRVAAAPSIEEVTERIVRRVEAIKRHRERDGG